MYKDILQKITTNQKLTQEEASALEGIGLAKDFIKTIYKFAKIGYDNY